MDSNNKIKNSFIIGGTIKAATSSVFTYLSAHPEICGSIVKETFFFTRDYTGNVNNDLENYNKYFKPNHKTKITLEASPNYLSYKTNVAPHIKSVLPDVKLLFILRNPVDRIYSHYYFSKGKLDLPKNLSFEAFVDICEQKGDLSSDRDSTGIAERNFRALEIGKYSKYLQNYLDEFPPENIKVVFFDDIRKNPVEFMESICQFIGVEAGFYSDYEFNKVNVTFSSQIQILHRIVLFLNKMLEPILRQRPVIKKLLVRVYKRINQNKEGYKVMEETTRNRLEDYYSSSNKRLATMLADQTLPDWLDY